MPAQPLYLTWDDDFNRVDAPPLAGPYVVDWDAGPWAAMDGSVLVGPPVGESFGYAGWSEAIYGRIQYDILITASGGTDRTYYEVECSGENAQDLWVFDNENANFGEWLVGSSCALKEVLFYPTPGDWWTVKCDTYPTFCRIKAWKRGDPEPDWQVNDIAYPHSSYAQYIEIDSGNSVAKIDNFRIWESLAGSPTAVLKDSLWEAEDQYPALRAAEVDGSAGTWTGAVDVTTFTADANDPSITGIPLCALKGEYTAWSKVVLPARSTIDFDARNCDYQMQAMLVYRLEEDGVNLTLVHQWSPWVTKTMSLSNPLVARCLNHPNMTAGSGSMPTGVPGVTHTMMQSRVYTLFDWWLPGGYQFNRLSWWAGSNPGISFDVWVSGQNVGYAKSLIVKLQREYTDGSWVDCGASVSVASIVSDSRLGHSYRAQLTDYFLGAGDHLGHYRLVVLETGNGGEIWTDSATVTMKGVPVVFEQFKRITPRIVADYEPGTYLVCITALNGSLGYANLITTLSHPVRTDG